MGLSFSHKRYGHGSAVHDGSAFMMGGCNSLGVPVNDVWVSSPELVPQKKTKKQQKDTDQEEYDSDSPNKTPKVALSGNQEDPNSSKEDGTEATPGISDGEEDEEQWQMSPWLLLTKQAPW